MPATREGRKAGQGRDVRQKAARKPLFVVWRRVGSGEREGQQTRAQKSETARGQCKKSVGDQIAVAHDAPSDSQCSSELIKVFGTSLFEKKPIHAAAAYVRERIPSNAWARKIPAPTRPISAVMVSNIANVLCAPRESKRRACPHSQKDSGDARPHSPRPRILRNRCPKTRQLVRRVPTRQPLANHRKGLPISAAIPMRYRRERVRMWGRILK
jgi:hypothetical protein